MIEYRIVGRDGTLSAPWPWEPVLLLIADRRRRVRDPGGWPVAVVRAWPERAISASRILP